MQNLPGELASVAKLNRANDRQSGRATNLILLLSKPERSGVRRSRDVVLVELFRPRPRGRFPTPTPSAWSEGGGIYYAPGTRPLYKQRSYARCTRNDTNGRRVYLCDNQDRETTSRAGNKTCADNGDVTMMKGKVFVFYFKRVVYEIESE